MKLMIEGYKSKIVRSRWEIVAFLARKDIVDAKHFEVCVDEINDIRKTGAEVCYGRMCPYFSEINKERWLVVSDDKQSSS